MALLSAAPQRGRARTPGIAARQFHNQPEASHQHRFLVDLWAGVAAETDGLLTVTVHAENGGLADSDPGALRLLRAGGLEFMTLMGGILGQAVPVTEIQSLPFAFRDPAHAWAVQDGPFGDLLRTECAAAGIFMFPHGTLENGFRHISSNRAPVTAPADLAGLRIRVPDGEIFRDLFRTLGAEPVTINIRDLYAALRDGRVAAQENPLVITEVNRLYEVQRCMSLTGHMWSGFNLIAHLGFWQQLPEGVRGVVLRRARAAVAAQRAYTDTLNRSLEAGLAARGMLLNRAAMAPFRAALPAFYARWKAHFGARVWAALEAETGRLG